MQRKILVADPGMIYTDFFTWGTKIYLSPEKDEAVFFEVPMEEYLNAYASPENLDGAQP